MTTERGNEPLTLITLYIGLSLPPLFRFRVECDYRVS